MVVVPANWTEFLPPPPEHPPPIPHSNFNQAPSICYTPESPGSLRRAAQRAGSGMSNHMKYFFYFNKI